MRIVVHKMVGCKLCHKCEKLLDYWNIEYTSVYDKPEQNRPYPYITYEYEYEELIVMIAKEC